MFRNTDKLMLIVSFLVIIMLLAENVNAKENTIDVRFGVYTDHPFSDGYDILKKKQFKGNYYTYEYEYIKDKEFNENNKSISIEYKNILLATFENSFNDRTYYLAYNVLDETILNTSYGSFSLTGYMGATKGYIKGKTLDDDLCISKNVCYQATIGIEYEYESYLITTGFFGAAFNVSIGKSFDLN